MSLNGNHMSEGACYQSAGARHMAVFSLLRVAHHLMSQSTVITRLSELETIRDRSFPIQELHAFMVSRDPPFLDAFRIATAFENLFKAQLLMGGYVVHLIDRKKALYNDLAQRQKSQPIRVSKLRSLEAESWRKQGPFTINGLTHKTLELALLLDQKHRYWEHLNLSKEFVQALDSVRRHRNTVHLVVNDSWQCNTKVVSNYRQIRDTFNARCLPLQQHVVAKYEHLRNQSGLLLRPV